METIDIKGKQYVMVNERIKHFRENYRGGSIMTELIKDDGESCLFKATIIVEDKVRATGFAREVNGSSFINKTSYIENCETSAIGRALGVFGIGIDTSIASYEEVSNAVKQEKEPSYRELLVKELKKQDLDFAEFAKEHKLNNKTSNKRFKEVYESLV